MEHIWQKAINIGTGASWYKDKVLYNIVNGVLEANSEFQTVDGLEVGNNFARAIFADMG